MSQTSPVLMQQLYEDFEAVKAFGSPLLQCQGMLVPIIDGNPLPYRLLIQSCPRPQTSNSDPAEANYAGGLQVPVAGVPKTMFEGSLTLIETEAGHVRLFSEYIQSVGGSIDCEYYDGRPGYYTNVSYLVNCCIRLEPGEASADGRSQVMTISGSITYNYFGEFSNLGNSGTGQIGKRKLSGIAGFIQKIQQSVNVLQSGANLLRGGQQLGNAVRGLLG